MSDFNYQEFAGLGETGYEDQEPVKPEDEFFHAVYIAGKTRKNHINVEEIAGKFQIRGVEYNLESVNMIITHIKKVLVKTVDENRRQVVKCFSYKSTPMPPWYGYEGRVCGSNSAERASIEWCNPCREQIIVAGIYCDENGSPVLNKETKKPYFIFLRGKGMKYNNVSQYLGSLYKMDLDPLFTPVTEESKNFEKKAVNNKRFITKVGKGIQGSDYGDKDVFTFEMGAKLPNKTVMEILKITKQTLPKFNEKFDWSKPLPTGYTPGQPASAASVDPSNKIPDPQKTSEQTKKPDTISTQTTVAEPQYNFEDIEF